MDASTHTTMMTVAGAMAAGITLTVIARRSGLPAIVLLLAGGVLLGPAVLGEHYAVIQPDSLGGGLSVLVSLAVGLILFEGGLTLDLSGYRSAPAMIKRLLSLGVLTTWLGAALALFVIVGLEPAYALLAASMVTVTGPTVIAPLLKRLKVNARLHSILHWEGVLVDPIGVFLAILCFEVVVSGDPGAEAAAALLVRIVSGLGIGVAGGFLLTFLMKRRIVPEDMMNVFALGFAALLFALADAIETEAGLLAVTAAGFVFGATGPTKVRQVRRFKAEITDLLIGTLFILLSARLEPEQFLAFGLAGAGTVAVVMLVVRPLAIFLCSAGLDLSFNEKIFLGWVAPRGIVAASMASLFALSIVETDPSREAEAKLVETFVYAVIVSTIVLQGFTAGPLSRLLGLKREDPIGWLIVGAHALGVRVAEFLRRHDLPVRVVDTNGRAVREAEQRGVPATVADARDVSLAERSEFQGLGNLLALTDNEDLNVRLCQNWADVLGPDRVFRCHPTSRDPEPGEETPGTLVWTKLPKPSLLSSELQRGEASILAATGAEEAYGQLATPIATLRGTRLSFDCPSSEDESTEDPAQVLYLQRTAEHLLWSLRPSLVLTLHPTNLVSLFESVVDAMIQVVPRLSRDETINELLERESAFPTVLGHGVALPHAYANGLDGRLCAIARIPEGLAFSDADGAEPVKLVFLLLSPQGDPEGHLATLAEIARLVLDEDTRARLLAATTPLEVIALVGEVTKQR